jgi:tetratricopeptide (TPR) repeat protein
MPDRGPETPISPEPGDEGFQDLFAPEPRSNVRELLSYLKAAQAGEMEPRQFYYQMLAIEAQEVAELIHGAHQLLLDANPVSKQLLHAECALLEELEPYYAAFVELQEFARDVLLHAERLGNPEYICKALRVCAAVYERAQPPDHELVRDYYVRWFNLHEKSFPEVSGTRATPLLSLYCEVVSRALDAFDYDTAQRASASLASAYFGSGILIDASTIRAARCLADAYSTTAQYDAAREVFEDLVARADGIKPCPPEAHAVGIPCGLDERDSIAFAVALRDYGDVLLSLPGYWAEAETVLRRAEQLLRPNESEVDPDGVYVNVMISLADALSAQGRITEAMQIRQRFGE